VWPIRVFLFLVPIFLLLPDQFHAINVDAVMGSAHSSLAALLASGLDKK